MYLPLSLARLASTSAVLLALSVSAHAQQRIIVDASNGAGAHFTALPPAVAAARDGDTILVRVGRYAPFQTSKALTIVADPGAVLDGGSAEARVTISDVAKGKRLVLAGFILDHSSIEALRCQGELHFTGLAMHHAPRTASLAITLCDKVVMHGCALKLVHIHRSAVFASDCIFAHNTFTYVGTPAVRVTGARFEVTASTIVGGDGEGHAAAWAGIVVTHDNGQGAQNSDVRVFGDATTSVRGGVYLSVNQMPAIESFAPGATLEIDPRVHTVGGVRGFASVRSAKRLSLSVGYAFLGQATAIRAVRGDEQAAAVFVSTQSTPIALPGIGAWWLEPTLQTLLVARSFGSAESFEAQLPLPTDPSLRGLGVAFQALGVRGTSLTVSNPVWTVLR